MTQKSVREAVGIFHDVHKMQDAIKDLEINGFERHHISVLGNDKAMEEEYGRIRQNLPNLEDDPRAPRSANVSPEEVGVAQGVIVGGGTTVGMIAGVLADVVLLIPGSLLAVGLTGGIAGTAVGAYLAKKLGDRYYGFFEEQVERGGILLWVTTPTKDHESTAQKIFKDHNASNVHIHNIH